MPTSNPPVSCYIRTLNEERVIERTVRAARALVDEVIVIDSGSTDHTVALAEAAGARVLFQPWLGLGGQKRVGEQACRHDWLLDLDADEVVSLELVDEIRELFKNGEPTVKIYGLKKVTVPPVGTPFGAAYSNKLYDRRVIRMPNHRAWDQLSVPAGTPTRRLRGALLHHSFRDFANYVEKMNRTSTMMAQDGRTKSKAELWLRIVFATPFYFFKAYFFRGLYRAGLYGFALARMSAYGRWMRDVKLYETVLLRSKQK